ncbi:MULTISPECIES: hypothetical protein [unclassified Pseudomonas]|uniref:hypothetical protein n=1 Tax=unclassified Pseudomonas TaxID=196821 RepID=UPI00257ACB64|nr:MULTISPECIES: hypothetical protein [unclassified Pseudomonas]
MSYTLDNGAEFNSKVLADRLALNGVQVIFYAPRAPKSKLCVERYFQTLNTHRIPRRESLIISGDTKCARSPASL